MKAIICKLLWGILCFCIFVLFACSSKQKNTAAIPEEQGSEILLSKLGEKSAAYSSYNFFGGPNGPQPAESKETINIEQGIKGGSQTVSETQEGNPDDWTAKAWVTDITQGEGYPTLYCGASNKSDPSSCAEMTLSSYLKWRPYGTQQKWLGYASILNWTGYNKTLQKVHGSYSYDGAWETRNDTEHEFSDNNDPTGWSTELQAEGYAEWLRKKDK